MVIRLSSGEELTFCVEEERHRAFQALRKKHYEMKGAIQLGHQLEELEDEEEGLEEEEEEEPEDEDEGADDRRDQPMVNGHN